MLRSYRAPPVGSALGEGFSTFMPKTHEAPHALIRSLDGWAKVLL